MAFLIQRLSFSQKFVLFVLALILFSVPVVFFSDHFAGAATITWDGGGATNNWSEGANWSGDVAPGASDVATFDGTSTKDVTIDAAISVSGIDVNAGYTGTITQAAPITVGEGDWDMDTGTFVGGSDPITITGFFDIVSTTFTSTTGDFTVQEIFSVGSGATFAHNNGTVIFRADSTNRNISVTGGLTLNHVTLNATSNTNHHRVTAAGDVTVLGTMTLLNGELSSLSSGAFVVQGSLVHNAAFDGGSSGRVVLDAAIAFTPTLGAPMTGLILDDPGASFTGLGVATTTIFEGTITVNEGTWNAGAGILEAQTGFFVEPTGTFNHDNGTISFTGSASTTVNADTTGAGSVTLYDVVVNKTSATACMNIIGGDTVVAENTVTLTNGQVCTGTGGSGNGILQIDGTVSIAAGFDGGTGVLDLQVATSLAPAAGAFLPGFYLTNVGADFTGPGSGTVTIEGPVDLVASTFNAGAGTIEFEDDLTIPAGSTFNHNSGTIAFDHTSSADLVSLDATLTLNNLTLLGGGLNLDTGDRIIVGGALTLTDGDFNTGIIEQQGTFSHAAAFDGGSGTIEFYTLQNITLASGEDLPGFELLVAGSSVTGAGVGTENDIGGDIVLDAGTTLNAGAGTLNLSGGIDLSGGGTFSHDSGTIELLDGTSSSPNVFTFIGNITFNNFESHFNDLQEVIFDDASTFVVEGNFILEVDNGEGDPNDRGLLTLRSDNPGVAASIDVQDPTPFVFAVDVTDINNSGTLIYCVVQCTDGGNNTGWYFGQPGIIVSDISGNTTEAGGTATFTVVLRNQPLDDVTVPITSLTLTEGTVDAATLTFTTANWDTPQTVTVTGVDDAANDGGVEFTVEVGPGASAGDTGYDGLEAPDVVAINEDNDGPAGGTGVDFEDSAAFSHENIAEQIGVTWFEHDFYSTGFLMTGEFGVEVDLADTGVQAGCRIDVNGTEWIISSVHPDQTGWTGYIRIINDPASRAEVLDTTIVSGPVTYIECARAGAQGMEFLTDDLVAVRGSVDSAFESSAYKMVYDSAADTIWFDAPPTRVDITDFSYDQFTRESGFEPAMALDPTRGEIWYPNEDSNSITKIDTTTGVETNYPIEDNCESAEYDSVNDRIWVVCARTSGTADAVQEIDPDTGTVLQTIAIEADASVGEFSTAGLVYDHVNDRIWAMTDLGLTIVAIDASTGAYAFGTLADSTFDTHHVETSFANVKTPHYVEETNTLWILNAQCDGYGDIVTVLDAATGSPVGYIDVPGCPVSSAIDSATDTIWYTSDWEGTLTEVRIADNTVVEMHAGLYFGTPGYPVAVDGEGDIWTIDCCDPGMFEFVRNGVPWDRYYTSVSNDTAQLDVSTWTSIDSVNIGESLDGQSIFYTVSFDDRHTFSVFGSERPIASDEASVHGGVDGDWYYRDNANTWTPTPSNTQEESISLAIAAGANNQMDSTDMGALSSADWETLGFDPGTTTTLDISTTLYTGDPHDAPSVQSVAFTINGSSGGGGGGGGENEVIPSQTALNVQTCSATRDIVVELQALQAESFLLSEDPTFADVDWQSFVPGADERTMEIPFTLSEGDGTKYVYAKFRSSTLNQSETLSTSMILDQAGGCTDIPEVEVPEEEAEPVPPTVIGCDGLERLNISAEERETYMFGVAIPGKSTPAGLPSPASLVRVGDYIRSVSSPTVYCVTKAGLRSPYIDETTYFTHTRSFDQTRWVEDAALTQFVVTDPMLPKPGVTLVKFQSAAEVYLFERDSQDITRGTLRWITTEELTEYMFGTNWADYVIDLNPTLYVQFEFAAPILNPIDVDTSMLRAREFLNESSSEIAIVGTKTSVWRRVMNFFGR